MRPSCGFRATVVGSHDTFFLRPGTSFMTVVVQYAKNATVRKGRDGFLPLAQCDHCDGIITRGVEGRAAWKREDTEAYREVQLLHQGCFDALQENRSRRLKSMPLGEFARHFVHNLKAGGTDEEAPRAAYRGAS